MSSVPNNSTFNMQTITQVLYGTGVLTGNLNQCFNDSIAGYFDFRYGSKTMSSKNLLAFRDYGTNWAKFGVLYNWYAVTNAHNIAPTGWHVPTSTEWSTLTTLVGNNLCYIKATGNSTDGTGLWFKTTLAPEGTNQWGMNVQPSGVRPATGGCPTGMGSDANFWSSSQNSSTMGFYVNMDYTSSVIYWDTTEYPKTTGFNVRLVRNTATGWHSGDTIADYDGNVYNTVLLPDGNVWTVQNLATTHYNDGTLINAISDTDFYDWVNDTVGAYCLADNSSILPTVLDWDGNVYQPITIGNQVWLSSDYLCKHNSGGVLLYQATSPTDLYNHSGVPAMLYSNPGGSGPGNETAWYNSTAMSTASTVTIPGYRIPTYNDLNILASNIGSASVAGGYLKGVNVPYWGWTSPNTGGNNASSFNGYPTGRLSQTGAFDANKFMYFWLSDTTFNPDWYWGSLTYNSAALSYTVMLMSSQNSVPIRLIKN